MMRSSRINRPVWGSRVKTHLGEAKNAGAAHATSVGHREWKLQGAVFCKRHGSGNADCREPEEHPAVSTIVPVSRAGSRVRS